MTEIPGLLTAFAAGLLSFLSPCVLPLIPSYLTFLTGSTLGELREEGNRGGLRKLVLVRSLAFTLGFTVVFILLGFALSSSTAMLGGASRTWGTVAGAAIIVLGLNFVFDFLKILNFEKRVHAAKKPAGLVGAFAFGSAFAAGWSPCIGPILASILLLAGQGTSGRAALLLASYSAGLALPFLAVGLFFGGLEKVLRAMTARLNAIKIVSGLFLVLIGISMVLGSFQSINVVVARAGYLLRDFSEASPAAARGIAIGFYLAAAAAAGLLGLVMQKGAKRSSRRAAAIAMIGLFGSLAALEALGFLSSVKMAAGWLLYQGI